MGMDSDANGSVCASVEIPRGVIRATESVNAIIISILRHS
jgi:hypothetical protein